MATLNQSKKPSANSSRSSQTVTIPTSRQAQMWETLLQILAAVLDRERNRVQEESEALGLGDNPVWILRHGAQMDPTQALQLFRKINPELHLTGLHFLNE